MAGPFTPAPAPPYVVGGVTSFDGRTGSVVLTTSDFDPGAQVFNVRNAAYGAKGDGVTDDTAAIEAAYTACLAAGGGIVFMPDTTNSYLINNANGLTWADGRVQLWGGSEYGCQLKAGAACTAQVLNVTIPIQAGGVSSGGVFKDFNINKNGHAAIGILQYVATEGSVRTRFENIYSGGTVSGTDSYYWNNQGCEDNVYINCSTPYNVATQNRAMSFVIPYGACDIFGGQLQGLHSINAQQMNYHGGVAGPLVPVNTGGSGVPIINCTDTYLYDGGEDVTSGTFPSVIGYGGYLCNINLDGCVLISFNTNKWINGGIPVGALVKAKNCSWVQAASTGTTMTMLVDSYGAGTFLLEGGSTTVTAGNATTIALATLTSSLSVALMPIKCTGVNNIATNQRAVTTPGFPATTVAQVNTFNVSVDAYVLAGAVAVTVAVNGTTLIVIPALGACHFRLEPQDSFVPTYASGTPTWKWLAS